jgi:hypothetical protein
LPKANLSSEVFLEIFLDLVTVLVRLGQAVEEERRMGYTELVVVHNQEYWELVHTLQVVVPHTVAGIVEEGEDTVVPHTVAGIVAEGIVGEGTVEEDIVEEGTVEVGIVEDIVVVVREESKCKFRRA